MKNYIFTIAIVFAAVIVLVFPQYFLEINGFKLKTLIVPLLQIIMFGMGTTMSLADFRSVVKTPKAVFVGLLCQFTIMPFVGFGVANMFDFDPEVAAGILLIGCSPSGLALKMGKVATVGLAAALFGPIMNTTGSLLATWWGKRPPQ